MIDIKLKVFATESNQVVVQSETISGEDVDTRCYYLPPEQAVAVANAILQAAEHCGAVIQVQSAPVVTHMQHMALVRRAELIMRSMNRSKPDVIARHVVDTVLAGVL